MIETIGSRSKHYSATLFSPLEIDLGEETVREVLGYDKYHILLQKDWDNACSLVIKEFLASANLPVNNFKFEETTVGDNNGTTDGLIKKQEQ